jgi:hypothetical protein
MLYSIRAAVAILSLASGTIAQSVPTATGSQSLKPESGFVSQGKYVNAFFGFSLTLPQIEGIRDFTLPSKDEYHFLFGVQAQLHNMTVLTVNARQKSNISEEDARKAVADLGGPSPKQVTIGGKGFWKSTSVERSSDGKMHIVHYAAGINGYLLEVSVLSFDSELTKKLEESVESISFFDPAKALGTC